MASRIKIILHNLNFGRFTAKDAKLRLVSLIGDTILFKSGLPDDWKQRTYRRKLEYLRQFLPPGWVLDIYLEPKNTPVGKSVFKQAVRREDAREPIRGGARIQQQDPIWARQPIVANARPAPNQRLVLEPQDEFNYIDEER